MTIASDAPPAVPDPTPTLASGRSWRPMVLVALGLAVPLLLLFGRVTFGGRTLVPYDALVADPVFRPALEAAGVTRPHNDLVADLVLQNVVWKEYLARSMAERSAPLWNSHLAGGVPFAAAGQAQPLYPSTLLFLAMPADEAFGWNALLGLWLAALAMVAYGRSLRLGWFAATVMGLAWSASLLFVANTVFPMIQAGMAWTPLVLAAIERVARSAERGTWSGLPTGRAALWLVVLAVATALIALGGHVEILYYAGLLCAVYAVARSWAVGRAAGRGAGLRTLIAVGLAGAGGILLAGVQLVPLAELVRTNWRSGSEPYEQVAGYAFGVRQATTFVVPDFFGNPAHHAVRDLATDAVRPLTGNAFWGFAVGAKNYVEAAAYVGISTLLFAAIGLVAARRRIRYLYAVIAVVALSFVFGLPTYRLLYEVLPGFDQLRTPFRWVFPVMFAVVALAGLGADALARGARNVRALWLGRLALAAGAALTGLLVAARLRPQSWIAAVETGLARAPDLSAAAIATFGDTATFASYLYWRAAHLAAFVLLGAIAVVLLCSAGRTRRAGQWLAVGALAADLVLIGLPFNPAVDPALGDVTPRVVTWLTEAKETRWGRVVGFGDSKVLWPNSAMRFGLDDLRAYDSVLPSWSVASLSEIEPQDENLRFNRIGNLTETTSLTHPLLRALGGRYVVSADTIDADGVDLVFEGEARVYSVDGAMPRAWVVTDIKVVADPAARAAEFAKFDPASTVILERVGDESIWTDVPSARSLTAAETVVIEEAPNRLVIDAFAPRSGMLVISDAWFPGWRAWVESAAAAEDQPHEEREVQVYRANGMMRGVPVPAGRSTVRLEYFPMSWKVGLYASFLGLLLIIMLVAYGLWQRFVRVREGDRTGRLAVNTAGPMGAALLNKGVDFVFAMLMLRVLGPEDAGKYYTAITIIGFAEILTNFGLNLFTTREVARRPADAPMYLAQTSILRLGLWVAALPLLSAYVLYRAAANSALSQDTTAALVLLMIGLVPSNLNSALASIFQAFERMMVPAGVSIVSNFLKVALGAMVLLAGFGFVGLAGVSVLVNWVTFGVLGILLVREGVRLSVKWRPAEMLAMAGVSLPFMLNHLLATVFFKIDVLLLSQLSGDVVVGYYQSAYKWVDALLIIPAYLTMALFPSMSRQALDDRDGLRRAYVRAVRWLISMALPISLATTFLATPLIRLLGGAEYLPAGATALAIMIWFLPLSFANGIAQYVLLALDRQRLVTPSFFAAVTFNILANLWAIPRYGLAGAAAVTILSEVALLVPFSYGLRDLGMPPLLATIWRPALAASAMGLVLAATANVGAPQLIGAALGGLVYVVVLARIGGFTTEDRQLFRRFTGRTGEPLDHSI